MSLDGTHPDNRTKRFSRWINNPEVDAEVHFLPFAEPLLRNLSIRPLALIMDGSSVGRGWLILMVSVVCQRHALPIAWLVVKGRKGHSPGDTLVLGCFPHPPVVQEAICVADRFWQDL